MNLIFVKPLKDVIVINPATNVPLLAEGETVENSSYYRRRAEDGSVTITEAPKSTKK